jgi:hypothetical protein
LTPEVTPAATSVIEKFDPEASEGSEQAMEVVVLVQDPAVVATDSTRIPVGKVSVTPTVDAVAGPALLTPSV